MKAVVRPAHSQDAAGINAVYNPFILESAATFETEPYDGPKRLAWLAARASAGLPVVVAEAEGVLCGFASASTFDERPAYSTSVKTSVFVAPDAAGAGVGRLLYEALFDALALTPLHRAYALIVAPNPASVRLHEAFGFRQVSTLSEVGFKLGRRRDVMWFEKRLDQTG